jgi:hypothetical protein
MLLSLRQEKYVGTSVTHYGSVSGIHLLFYQRVPSPALKTAIQSIYDRFANNQKWQEIIAKKQNSQLSDVHFNSNIGGGEWVKAINTSWLWLWKCWPRCADFSLHQFC